MNNFLFYVAVIWPPAEEYSTDNHRFIQLILKRIKKMRLTIILIQKYGLYYLWDRNGETQWM
jgi:hypothetical protein